MPEINYKELDKHLKAAKIDAFFPVYLIHGEEALYKTSFNALLDALLPSRDMNYDPVENDDVYEAIARVNTFSLLPGTKVVSLSDSQIFYSKQSESSFLEKAKDAYDKKDMKKAGKFVAALLGILKLSFDDVNGRENRVKNVNVDLDAFGDDKWMDDIIGHCADKGIKVPPVKDHAGDLQKAIEKGFPEGNHLIITTDILDRRRTLFKAMEKNGLIIDCSVPKGNRMADRQVQEAVLNERMKAILARNGKRMDRPTYQALYEMTGFDLRTFSNNLEKLVSYVGDRVPITVEDVDAVLKRTKQDPIYELTQAVSDRNTPDALFFLNSLLQTDLFSLQILGAIINHMRKVLLAKGFAESPQGKKAWQPRMNYNLFQTRVMPAIQEYDRMLLGLLEKWDHTLSGNRDSDEGKKKKGKGKKKAGPSTDLLIAKNPKNAYPVYQMLLKSEKFTREELLDAMERLSEADLMLKTTGRDHKLVLERVVLHICVRRET